MDHHDIKNFNTLNKLSLINLGDTVVDVGACHGDYTSFFLRCLGATGKVYSIELMPQTYSFLEMRFGHFKNVEFINAAVSDKTGIEDVYVSDTNETNNIIGGYGQKVGEIRSITLDELLLNEKEISLIKIDVEGAELKVLKGMADVLKKTNTILLEVHYDDIWPEIRKILLEDNGFDCYNVESDEKLTMSSNRPYQCLCRKIK